MLLIKHLVAKDVVLKTKPMHFHILMCKITEIVIIIVAKDMEAEAEVVVEIEAIIKIEVIIRTTIMAFEVATSISRS